ncbi:sulfurtransferase [Kosakonia sacchari]|uniref:sulfurtransferase n=1 Tax=Kosakonia sacchari TaxID=1158459 RepID=UPI0015855C0C|nr:rhodanese-like domain-containing protein [Kosakonia sacchari]NUL35371.1 sulfurtransferase [Kosakonia sacchari]
MTPAPSPWVCATWLADMLQHRPVKATPEGEWRLLEVGCDAEHLYRAGHIPGADYIDTREVESLPLWNVLKPEQLRPVLLHHGLRADSTVILYGRGNYAAERMAHILLYAGIRDVRLLDGGWHSWLHTGLAEEIGAAPDIKPQRDFGVRIPAQPELLLNMAQTQQRLAQPGTLLVSIRSWPEFSGQTSGYDYIAAVGDIPGANWGQAAGDSQLITNFHHADGTVRNPSEIAALWQQQHITGDNPVIFYCGTGWRASFAFFIARALGWADIAVYDGGWFEWSQHTHGTQ